jgi:hypothetical protein
MRPIHLDEQAINRLVINPPPDLLNEMQAASIRPIDNATQYINKLESSTFLNNNKPHL